MKVLIWNNIWVTQGNFLFSFNCFKNYLSKEANILAMAGFEVDVALPEHFKDSLPALDQRVNIIEFNLKDSFKIANSFDPIANLYKYGKNHKLDLLPLSERLSDRYDLILLWETPVPFLEILYPEAVIVHQMPGIYSRPPAQNFITIDTQGLFKNSTLYTYEKEIKHYKISSLWQDFKEQRKSFFDTFNFYERKIKQQVKENVDIVLLPLQVSDHYNFKVDTKFSNQLDFLLEVINRNPDSNIIATQYVTQNISDTVLSESNLNHIKSIHKNFIFDTEFDSIPSASELILPHVDRIISCSSSLALQGVLSSKMVEIYGDTYIKPYDTNMHKYSTDAVGSFLLERYNLNFDFLLQNKKFFISLCEELQSKKNQKGIDRLVMFNDISEHYNESLEINREGRARKNWKSWIKKENQCCDVVLKEIRSPSIETVSFDIFDTLISRPLFKPTDLFKMLSKYVESMTNGKIHDFGIIRQEAESFLKEKQEEVSLNEIYNYICKKFELESSLIEKIKAKEIDLEISLCKQLPEGRRAYLEAKKLKKRIVLTSDMYLPKDVIYTLLKRNDFIDYDYIYVSSEIRKTKSKDGNLYGYVIKNENKSPDHILHIGDKKIIDVDNAQKKGLKAIRLISSIDRIKGQKKILEAFAPQSSIYRSAFLGLYKQRILNQECKYIHKDSLTQGSLYNFGYSALGPFILGYALWLRRIAKEKGYDCLYFLAREGLLIQRALNIIDKTINTKYLLASRRALYGASIQNIIDIYTYCSISFADKTKLSTLLNNRFGIDEKIFLEHFSDIELRNCSEDRKKVFDAALHFKDVILEKSKIQNKLYKEYLKESGLLDCKKPAIVDIGWQGRMQSRIQMICDKKIDGLYYATLDNALDSINTYAYIGSKIDKEFNSIATSYRKFIEYFICASTKSFIRFERTNQKRIEIYQDEDFFYTRSKIITEAHKGALSFVSDYMDQFDSVQNPSFKDCESVLAYFIKNNLFSEIEEFQRIKFNDEIAGSKNMTIITKLDSHKNDKTAKINVITNNRYSEKSSNTKIDLNAKKEEETSSFKRKLERWIIDHCAEERYREKYYRDRDAYMRDSKSILMKILFKD